jgi:hypothetical protein
VHAQVGIHHRVLRVDAHGRGAEVVAGVELDRELVELREFALERAEALRLLRQSYARALDERWIHVSEGLPDDARTVLAVDTGAGVASCISAQCTLRADGSRAWHDLTGHALHVAHWREHPSWPAD